MSIGHVVVVLGVSWLLTGCASLTRTCAIQPSTWTYYQGNGIAISRPTTFTVCHPRFRL